MFDALSSSAASAGPAPVEAARPGRFTAEVHAELRRLARPPREDLSILAGNALLVCACWFLLPLSARNWLFELHGRLAFAIVLESWMLADTPTTNLLGNDARAALTALPDRRQVRRLLHVKATALACVVGPVSALAGVAIAVRDGRYGAGVATTALLLAVPFGTTAISSWLGMLFPYHRRSLRWRWAHRRRWRQHLRWAALVVTPYTVVPMIYGVLVGPAVLAATRVHHRDRFHHLSGPSLFIGCLVACVLAAIVYVLGSQVAAWLAVRRARTLQAYLADPDLG